MCSVKLKSLLIQWKLICQIKFDKQSILIIIRSNLFYSLFFIMGFYLGIALAVWLWVYFWLSFYNDADWTWVKIIGFIKSIRNKIIASIQNFFLKIWKFIKWILNVCWDIISYIPRKFWYKILHGSWILLKYLIYLIIISWVLYMIYLFIRWGKWFVRSDAFIVTLLYIWIPSCVLLIISWLADISHIANKNKLNKTEKEVKEEKKRQEENFNKRNKLMLRFFMFVPLSIIIWLVIRLAMLLIKQHLS